MVHLIEQLSSWWNGLEHLVQTRTGPALRSIFGIVLAALAGRLSCRFLVWGFWHGARRSRTTWDDLALSHLSQPVRFLMPLASVLLVLPVLELGDFVRLGVRQVLVVAIILDLGWLAYRVVRVVEEVIASRLRRAGNNTLEVRSGYTQLQGFRSVAGFVIGIVTIGLALLSFGSVREVGASLLASAGVAGIAVGFAAQRSIAAVLAGITISVAQPIRVGDVVVLEGEWGSVEEITLTHVVMRIWDQRRLILPISYFMEKPFENWTHSASSQILASVLIHLDYCMPVDRLRSELKGILDASPDWDHSHWRLEVTDSTARSMVVRPVMSAKDALAAWRLRCEVREKLIGFVQAQYPSALPRLRTQATPAGADDEVPAALDSVNPGPSAALAALT